MSYCNIELKIELNNIFDKNMLDRYFKKINGNGKYISIGFPIKKIYGEIIRNHDTEIIIQGWITTNNLDKEDACSIFTYLNEICFMEKMTIMLYNSKVGTCEKFVYDCNNANNIKHYTIPCALVDDTNNKMSNDYGYTCFEKKKKFATVSAIVLA